MAPGWLWIVLTVWAAFAQTLRNAAQRHLVTDLGTLGATLVRFLFGLPFALIYFGIILTITGDPIPGVNLAFVAFSRSAGIDGQIFVFFVMTVAAAEAAVGLALVIAIFRHIESVDMKNFNLLRW